MLEEKQPGNNEITRLKVKCEGSNDEFILNGRPCEFSAFSFVPPSRRYEPTNRSIYNFKSEKRIYASNYDQLFDFNYGYDGKVHRCDRRHAKLHGLNVWKEELKKDIPSRSSSEYGHRLVRLPNSAGKTLKNDHESYLTTIDPQDRKHVRIMTVKSEFYNRNGLNDLTQSNSILFQ